MLYILILLNSITHAKKNEFLYKKIPTISYTGCVLTLRGEYLTNYKLKSSYKQYRMSKF